MNEDSFFGCLFCGRCFVGGCGRIKPLKAFCTVFHPNTLSLKPVKPEGVSNTMEGRVKWFNEKKGYGFVETENNGDIFVHYSGIEDTGGFRSLQEGEKVDFEIEQTQRGPQAVQVKKQGS